MPEVNAWLTEFERVLRQQPKGDPGLSTEELADALGVGAHRVNKMLRVAYRAGRLKAGKKPGWALDGRRCVVPCYQLLPVKAAKKR